MNETVAPEIEQTELAVASIVNVTGRPDGEAVAVTVYVAPPTEADSGAGEVNVIVCVPLPTANDCCACSAAL